MPRVPLSQDTQVREVGLQGGYRENLDVTAPARQLSQALGSAADALGHMAQRDAETETWGIQSKMLQDFSAWRGAQQERAQGVNAKGYAESVQQWWKDAEATYASKASPLAKDALRKSIAAFQTSNFDAATSHEQRQLDIANGQAFKANVSALEGQAIDAGPDRAAPIVSSIQKAIRMEGGKRGLDLEPEALASSTRVHVNIISKLMQSDPARAERYYTEAKLAKQIDPAQFDNIEKGLSHATAANDGERSADETWKTLGPKNYNDPVALDKMEAKLREAYANDAPRRQAAIAALRERAAAHNAAQAETNAGNVNSVYKAIDGGMSMVRVMRTPQWLALPGKEQDQILAQQESRAAAREGRAAAAEQRAFTAEQRKQHRMLLDNAGEYLRVSDPEALAKMTRPQVEALRSTFGFEGTQHLLNRYDSLQKNPGDLTEAKIDEDAFKRIGKDFGIETYNPRPSDKELVGTLKYRVERVLGMAQAAKGKKLTEEEKESVMRQELSHQVILANRVLGTGNIREGWWNYLNNASRMPVILLQPDQAQRVFVPKEDREKISEALATMYKRDPKNPAYAPTESNMRRLYLMRQSRAGALIPEGE